ncbi:hypothetical protein L0F63_001121 [Massospora cicadina]|nr:hypothetical protein L0F63_001121 [Massospora cicadina]
MVLQPVINKPSKNRWTEQIRKPVNHLICLHLTTLKQVNPNYFGHFIDHCVVRLFDRLTPTPSQLDYYQTILKRSNATYQIMITSLVYLTRLAARQSPILMSQPAHVIYTVLLILAFAFMEDSPYYTKSWAEVSNLSTKLLNRVVLQILTVFDYRLMVAKQQYMQWESCALKFFQRMPVSVMSEPQGQDFLLNKL